MEKAQAAGAKTERERDYIAAIEAFYKDADNRRPPRRARSPTRRRWSSVSARYPDDREAAIFYALALLGTAPPTDKTYANQKKAGADPQQDAAAAARPSRASPTT